jgi:hypothetical protein
MNRIIAWAIVALLLSLVAINLPRAGAAPFDPVSTELVNDADPDLINDELGNDPDVPTNYNVDRIEDVDVPGPVEVRKDLC